MPDKRNSRLGFLRWFQENYDANRTALRGRLRRRGVLDEDLEDLEQDVILRIVKMDDHEPIANPKGFLLRMADNLVIDRFRKSRNVSLEVIENFDSLDISDLCASLEQELVDRERLRVLGEIVDTLPPKAKQVFVLQKLFALSIRETAEILGVSPKTVENHAVKAMRHCREKMREKELI